MHLETKYKKLIILVSNKKIIVHPIPYEFNLTSKTFKQPDSKNENTII